jgi:hypothetical protein
MQSVSNSKEKSKRELLLAQDALTKDSERNQNIVESNYR